jgi:alpha-beta hydrolase superfamily lysophospholipase
VFRVELRSADKARGASGTGEGDFVDQAVHAEPEPFEAGTGLATFVWRVPHPRASVLLQHGYAEYCGRYIHEYSALIPALVAAGFTVFAMDLPGHGKSPGPRGTVNVPRAIERHVATRQAIMASGAVGPLFLLGHSLGGLVTAGSAVRSPDHIAGVVLSAPALYFPVNSATRLVARCVAAIAPTLGSVAPRSASGLSRIPDVIERFAGDPHIYRGKVPFLTAATIAQASHSLWRHYKAWTLPSLVVHGDADIFTPYAGSVRFIDSISSADKHLETVSGGRHEALNDIGREQILALILLWLSERSPPAKLPQA